MHRETDLAALLARLTPSYADRAARALNESGAAGILLYECTPPDGDATCHAALYGPGRPVERPEDAGPYTRPTMLADVPPTVLTPVAYYAVPSLPGPAPAAPPPDPGPPAPPA